MTYPAVLLINRAWNLSGIVARDFETVSGGQATDGLFLLNELLDFKASDLSLIPYFTRYAGTFVVGQEKYSIPTLFEIETLTFNLMGPVRYPMAYVARDKYFGFGRVNNIQSIPYQYHYERVLDGVDLYVYYLPDQAYPFEITGKFGLIDVSLNTDLLTVYDQFYIAYLRYALANYMCLEYDIAFAPEKLNMLKQLEKKLTYTSPPDMTLKKVNFISSGSTLNWAQINVGLGWYPY